jgi:hypothetical protein
MHIKTHEKPCILGIYAHNEAKQTNSIFVGESLARISLEKKTGAEHAY